MIPRRAALLAISAVLLAGAGISAAANRDPAGEPVTATASVPQPTTAVPVCGPAGWKMWRQASVWVSVAPAASGTGRKVSATMLPPAEVVVIAAAVVVWSFAGTRYEATASFHLT